MVECVFDSYGSRLYCKKLCVIHFKFTFFLARLDKDISVDGVEGGTADRRLLDEEFQTVVAGGAEVDLSLAILADFHR